MRDWHPTECLWKAVSILYFDNRNNSEDSRYGDIGNINKKYIVGKVWFVISPKDKFGFLKG